MRALAAALLLAAAASAQEIPGAVVVLEVPIAAVPGEVGTAAPVRFALMEDGTVYVGGSRRIMTGRLDEAEVKALERRVSEVRKLPLTGVMTLGPGNDRRRLFLRKGRPLDLTLTGEPGGAGPALRPLAALVEDLEQFQHASLRPYAPLSLAMSAKEGTLPGGCRPWLLPEPLAESVFAPRVVPAQGHGDWPTGTVPASVCLGEKRYVVTFRPLIPGERP